VRTELERLAHFLKTKANNLYRRAYKVSENEQSYATRDGGASRNYRSLGEVAAILGVTRQAVQQIERVALRKLRLAFIEELRDYNPALAAEIMKDQQ
jgi:DNA-directed RNA polymerase sigma subunit (sigma70/sigma32)